MAWGKSTKQRRAMRRRRGRNGHDKRRYIGRVSRALDAALQRSSAALAHIVWDLGGFTSADLGRWL